MIGILQRLLQFLVLVGLIAAIIKADVLPSPIQPVALKARAFLIGPQVSWSGFISTWQYRYSLVAASVPFLRQLTQAVPSTTDFTPESIMNLTINMILVQPVQKWDKIKQDFMNPPPASSSSPSALIQ